MNNEKKCKHLKYKIGDLVKLRFPIEFGRNMTGKKIRNGEIGLIIDIIEMNFDSLGVNDYLVYVSGHEIIFCEKELDEFKPKEQ